MSTTLKASTRERVGTRHSQRLRSEGRIPVSLQSGGTNEPVSLSINEDEFLRARRAHEHVYTLSFGSQNETALVHELQWDTFGEKILHVEFLAADLNVKSEVEVPLEFLGHAKGGGMLNHLITKISVLAKPEEIPDSIEASIEGLDVGDSLLAQDLKLPAGVDLAGDPERVVATITVPDAEDEVVGEDDVEEDGEAGPPVSVEV